MNLKSILGAILSGCLLTLTFPRFNLEVLAWVALVPLLLSVYRQDAIHSFYLGTLCGIVHYLGTIYWVAYTITRYGKLSWGISIILLLLLVLYLGLYIGAFAALLSWGAKLQGSKLRGSKLGGGFLIGPCLWVALEYLRTYLFTGFPWALLGYSQYLNLPVIQLADITGVYGISFLILLINCSIASILMPFVYHSEKRWVSSPSLRIGLASLGILLICLAYGWWRMSYYAASVQPSVPLKVAVVQGNIEQDKKWDPAYQEQTMQIYKELSQQAAQANPQLIVWPETATPFYFQSNEKYQPQLLNWTQSWGTWLLFGSPGYQPTLFQPKLYNSAFLLSPRDEIAGVYHKLHLVPFGEYVPLKALLGFAGKLVAQVGDFSSGGEYTILQLPQGNFGVVICYEIIFPQLVRQFFDRGAQFLVNITNDAWFGKTSAPFQHFSMLTLRAVENRSFIVRAANTGISGFVDPMGRIQRASPIFVADYLVDTIHLGKAKSFYAEYGDIFSWWCIIMVGGWMVGAGKKKKEF